LPEFGRLGGVVTAAELDQAGFGRHQVRGLVRNEVLLPVRRGIYARAEQAARLSASQRGERALQLAAAVAASGPQAVGSHHDAAFVHGLALLDGPPGSVVTVSRPPDASGSHRSASGVRLHRVALPASQVTVVGGVPVTSVARTIVDLARTTPFRSGVVVADSALHIGKVSKPALESVIAACAHWPGIGRARRVAEFADRRSESPFESIARVAFRDGGLPPPQLQAWVGDDTGLIGRVDFLWRERRTVAEADGAIKYADLERARKQLRRDAALRQAGFEVVHFTWGELIAAPEQVVGEIRTAFRRARTLAAAERQQLAQPRYEVG